MDNVINEAVNVIEKLTNKVVELKAQVSQLSKTNESLKSQNIATNESVSGLADILKKAEEALKD
ncbi:MAG: hypothetical protein HUJ68_07535 [Clostridia bacterium]|nr:hypothetical protein [Clostridia bacterium]